MRNEQDRVTVVIRDQDACLLAAALDTDTALTLLAVASEDPNCWEDPSPGTAAGRWLSPSS